MQDEWDFAKITETPLRVVNVKERDPAPNAHQSAQGEIMRHDGAHMAIPIPCAVSGQCEGKL